MSLLGRSASGPGDNIAAANTSDEIHHDKPT
jgi:hypothetical protein